MDTAVVSMPDARRLGPKHQLGHVVAHPVGAGGAVAHDADVTCRRSQLVLRDEDRIVDCRAIAVTGLCECRNWGSIRSLCMH